MIAHFFWTGILLCRIDFCSIICLMGHHSDKQFLRCLLYILVISCEPVNVETESRNFSALEAQRGMDGNKTSIPFSIFLPM